LNETDWGREVQTSLNVNSDLNQDAQDDTEIDLDLAYLTLKEMFDSPVTLTLGRQELMWGAGFVLGDPDTNRTSLTNYPAGYTAIANRDLSLRKSFDAVKANLDYDPLVIDLIYSKIDENQKSGAQMDDENDEDLYAAKAMYTLGDDWGTMVEGYYLYTRDETLETAPVDDNSKTDTVHCPGLRVVTAPIKDLILTGEIAWQYGTYSTGANNALSRNREAMATQATATYALPFEKIAEYKPVIGAAYSYYSGDKNPDLTNANSGKYKAWDPLFENQGTGTIYNVLFNSTNVHVLNLNATCVPIEDVKLRFDYTDLWLARNLPIGRLGTSDPNLFTLYCINGDSSNPRMGDDHLGREFDLMATYDYTEDVQFGLSAGWFVPGNAFMDEADEGNNHEVATQLIGSCAVSF
jgi:hypothetical protein